MSTAGHDIELLHFRFSPYNEKVRWALDLKRLAHRRKSLLPGPHMPAVRRATGQSATPVLRIGDQWLAGSARIIAALDDLAPQPHRLIPGGSARARALEIQRRFDEDWTPRMRRVVLAGLMGVPGGIATVFGGHKSAPVRLAYRATVPLAKRMIAKGNGITGPGSIADGRAAMAEAMAFVEAGSTATGYLAGEAFSVADMTAACALATLLDMTGTPMQRPVAAPPEIAGLQEKWRNHPGAVWTRNIFARHRGAAMAADGAIEYPAAG